MRFICAVLEWLFPYSLEEAAKEYEAAGGHAASVSQAVRFEAVCWVLAASGNAPLALRRFEEEVPRFDMSQDAYEEVRAWLSRWAKATKPVVTS